MSDFPRIGAYGTEFSHSKKTIIDVVSIIENNFNIKIKYPEVFKQNIDEYKRKIESKGIVLVNPTGSWTKSSRFGYCIQKTFDEFILIFGLYK